MNKEIMKALKLYKKREISIGRAAKIAQMPLADFMKLAAEKKIPINYSVQDFREDISHDSNYGQKSSNAAIKKMV